MGVVPTHRRRGLLTALMRRQLEDVRESGEPFAALYASEGAIYPRFGYGLSSLAASVEIDRARATFRTDATVPVGRVRLVDRRRSWRGRPAPARGSNAADRDCWRGRRRGGRT